MDETPATPSPSETASLSEVKRKLLERYSSGQNTSTEFQSLEVRPPAHAALLSPAQEQIVVRSLSSFATPSLYNESITIHRHGALDMHILERSLSEIIRRHEIWRTVYAGSGHETTMRILPACNAHIPVVDLSHIPAQRRVSEALQLASEDARRPFRLADGPLIRAFLAKLDERNHRLFLTMHQSVVDGVSVYKILPWELTLLYNAFSAGTPSPLPDLTLQFSDFAFSERENSSALYDAQLSYWRTQLSCDVCLVTLPGSRPERSVNNFAGSIHAFTLPADLVTALRSMSQSEAVSLFTILLTGFGLLLGTYSSHDDIVVGTVTSSGRKRQDVQSLLGYFLNPVALRLKLSGSRTVSALLQQIQDVVWDALSNDDVTLERVTEVVNGDIDPIRDSLFRMAITLAPTAQALAEGWRQSPMDLETGWSRWDLYLELTETPAEIICRAQYKSDVFSPEIIAKFAEDFERKLQDLISDQEQALRPFVGVPRFGLCRPAPC